MISVIIPLYNKESYIKDTLESVLNQTYTDYEMVVVNDGSEDRSAEIVRTISMENSRIRLIDQQNQGVSAARNRGVKEAFGEYVCFLDADDRWQANHLEEISCLVERYKDKVDVFVTNFARQFPDGEQQINREDLPKGVVESYFRKTRRAVVIHTSCICMSKKAFSEVGGFDTRFAMGEDIHLWRRLARRFKVAYSPVVTSIYMIDTLNNSAKNIDYSKDAAQVAMNGPFADIYDWYSCLCQYLKYQIKKRINYAPQVDKRK